MSLDGGSNLARTVKVSASILYGGLAYAASPSHTPFALRDS